MKTDKLFWTNDDFEEMCWHDNFVHAISYDTDIYTFELDIDYIFEWGDPKEERNNYFVRLAPTTLVFENAFDLSIDIAMSNIVDFSIYEIKRVEIPNKHKPNTSIYRFTIEMEHLGNIQLKSTGYSMYVRDAPMQSESLWLTKKERGGISLSREIPAT